MTTAEVFRNTDWKSRWLQQSMKLCFHSQFESYFQFSYESFYAKLISEQKYVKLTTVLPLKSPRSNLAVCKSKPFSHLCTETRNGWGLMRTSYLDNAPGASVSYS